MSHAIDFDGISERLFVLQHLVHGSVAYCEREGITADMLEDDEPFQNAWGWTKVLASNYLIECAVKLRMVQDFCSKQADASTLQDIERQAAGDISIGRIIKGSFPLTVREACNKIIHATHATIDFVPSTNSTPPVLAWDGLYNLYGSQGANDWHLELDVARWASVAARFLALLERDERTLYMGQDYK